MHLHGGLADESTAGRAIVAMTMAVGVSVLLGLWNGFLVSVLGIQPIIATLVLMTAGRGLAMLITDGQITTVNNSMFKQVGAGFVLGLPVAILIALAVFAITALLTRRTALGMLIEAVGINPEASRLAGVRARTITWTVYVFVAFCAGIAGLMIASNTSAADANAAGCGSSSTRSSRSSSAARHGRRPLLADRHADRCDVHPDPATTIPTIGIPAETNYLFKAVVVIVVCLLQSPKARAVLSVRRPSPCSRRDPPHDDDHRSSRGPVGGPSSRSCAASRSRRASFR